MSVSVIIPTYQGETHLRALLPRLQMHSPCPDEVVVVDSSSTDGGVALARAAGCVVHVIPQLEFDHGATRNLGARLAQGEILVFMTQDALPVGEGWLAALIAPLQNGEAVAAYARQQPKTDAGLLEAFARHYNYPAVSQLKNAADTETLGIKAFFFSNVCAAVCADVFWQVGGFSEGTIQNEDMVLAAKLLAAGYTLKYNAEVSVLHSHNYTLAQQFRRNFDVGAALAQAAPFFAGASASGAGLRFVRAQCGYVLASGRWWWLPRVLLEAATKFVAFQLGHRERHLPRWLKPSLSMHRHYWQRTPEPLRPGRRA